MELVVVLVILAIALGGLVIYKLKSIKIEFWGQSNEKRLPKPPQSSQQIRN